MSKIGVVGMSSVSLQDCPLHNPLEIDDDWLFYGLPWHEEFYQLFDVCFEMHPWEELKKSHARRPVEYKERLNWLSRSQKVYMQKAVGDVPGAEAYPLGDIVGQLGIDYFNSSIAYAMAMAICNKPSEISIWGVDMTATEEYAVQRPNMEFLIGLAVGRGIDVKISNYSPLCKFDTTGIHLGNMEMEYKERYGWL